MTALTPRRKGSKVGHLKEIHGMLVLYISETDCWRYAWLQLTPFVPCTSRLHPLSIAAGHVQRSKRCYQNMSITLSQDTDM